MIGGMFWTDVFQRRKFGSAKPPPTIFPGPAYGANPAAIS
jgi:hypothetical protein